MRWLLALLPLVLSFHSFSSELVIRMSDDSVRTLPHQEILSHLEESTFTTQLPWIDKPHTFSGIKVSTLLNYLDIDDAFSVSFIALNDYAATSKIDDLIQYEPIIAYKINGKTMKVRNKGPYWLVYNLDKYPELDNAEFHSQMVWQIDELMVYKKQDVDID